MHCAIDLSYSQSYIKIVIPDISLKHKYYKNIRKNFIIIYLSIKYPDAMNSIAIKYFENKNNFFMPSARSKCRIVLAQNMHYPNSL